MSLLLLMRYWQYVVIVVLSLLLIFMTFMLRESAHTMQSMRITHTLETANNIAEYEMRARQIEQHNYKGVIDAINESTERQKQIASDYDNAIVISNSLSETITNIEASLISDNANARTQYTTAISNISRNCIGEITELARRADQHVSDIKMMQQAWPKK